MRTSSRIAGLVLWIEAVVCFVPVAAVLAWSALLIPTWILMLVQASTSAPKVANPWALAYVAALIPGVPWALAGFIAVMRVVSLLSRAAERDAYRGLTLCALVGWLVVVVALAVVVASPVEDVVDLLTFAPAVATVHILFLARRLLVPALFAGTHNKQLQRTVER